MVSIAVSIEVVTPVLGGGSQVRELDQIDIIRPTTVRGHLRFWWRLLRGHQFASSKELSQAEGRLWGRANSDGSSRALVDVRVEVRRSGPIDDQPVQLGSAPGAYALWPARQPPASRRGPGTRFVLSVSLPQEHENEMRNVIRAWLLFGGYGSRTRRGLGSLTVTDDAIAWLPVSPTREALVTLFGCDLLMASSRRAGDTPWVAGASLCVGAPYSGAPDAWTVALNQLRDFRQGQDARSGEGARQYGSPQRPSRSNWPEADKIRHLRGKTAGHRPRHNATPVWPRAGFGLPINGRFQTQGRDGGAIDEPGRFTLGWRSRSGDEPARLASPLIVKALPLADRTFVPCWLWLNRAYPDGEVILQGVDGSAAAFDRLTAPGDAAQFVALTGKGSLREAFFHWLQRQDATTVVVS